MNRPLIYIVLSIFLTMSCMQTTYVKKGDHVLIDLKLINKYNRVIDQTGFNQRKLPLLVKVGRHEVYEPIDIALVGMKLEEVKKIKLLAKYTYANRGVFYLNKSQDTTFVVYPNETLYAEFKVLKIN